MHRKASAITTSREIRRAEAIREKIAREGGALEHVCRGCGRHVTPHPSELCDVCFFRAPGGGYDRNV